MFLDKLHGPAGLPRLGRAICLVGASLGAFGLVAWLVGMERVLTVVPGLPPMMPNSAFALLLLGLSAASILQGRSGHVQRLLVTFAAIVVLAICLGTIAEYTLNTQLFLDQLVRVRVGPYYPNPSSPPTAIALALLAAGVLFSDLGSGKRFRPSEWLVLCAALIAITALLGYLYGASPRYRLTGPPIVGVATTSMRLVRVAGDLLIIGISFSTAVSLFLISAGLFLGRPDWGTMRIVAGRGPGGLMLRRLTPIAILVPIGSGVIASRLPGTGSVPLVLSGLTDVTTISSLFLMGITALRLDRGHDALEQARARARELIDLASDGIFIFDLDGRLTDVNEAGCRLHGYSHEEMLTKNISDLVLPEDKERLLIHKGSLLGGHTDVSEWVGIRKDGSRFTVEVSAKILPDGRWEGIARDVSERKRVKEALQLSEAKFSGMVSISADAIISVDEAQRITLFNEGAERIFGWSSAEIIGSPLDVLIPERFREIHARHVKKFMAGPDGARHANARELVYGLRRNGEEFPADASISKFSVGGKSVLSASLRDITERKRSEDALRQSQAISQQLASIVESSDDAIFSKDLNGVILSWNRGAERLYGYSAEEVIGKPDTILIPQDRHDEEPAIDDRVRRGYRVDHYETVRRRKDGSLFDVSLSVSPVRNSEGRIVGASKIARDITARKFVEEQIRQTQERLDLAIKGADLATWDWNVKTGKVIFNPRWAEMRGYRPEEIESHVDSAMADIHPDDLPAVQKGLEDCFNGVLPEYEMTFRISTKNGDWIWLLLHAKVFGRDEQGRPTRVAGTASDVTAQKRAEEALRLSEAAAKQAAQARDDILGVVAHDLRNPLQAITSLAAVLHVKGVEAEVGDEIAVAANHMNRLIGDLLDVTSMEAGHLSLKLERIPAAEVITDAVERQTPLASSASLELRLETAPELPVIWADRDRLLQVFENLIGNAVKFTKPGGRITLGATAPTGEVVFSVSDTGRGIASTHLPHVFDRFWQAPGTERRGMGFGLAIVKSIVEGHGGRVWVQSAPGQGSTFFFAIPTAAAQNTASLAAQ